MEFESILLKKEGPIATIILNRAEKRNAINRSMMEEIPVAVQEVSQDDNIRVLVLTGAGKSFCSGADTDLMGGGADSGGGERNIESLRRSFMFQASKKMILGIRKLEIPTIAMVNGACVGAGFDLALSCDMRTGSEYSRFLCGFTRLGLFPGFGATWFYPRIMGTSKALEVLLTGDQIDSKEAERIGLLNKLFSADELEKETMVLAQKMAAGPPIAIRYMKSEVYGGFAIDLETALERAAMCESITLLSQDHKEGLTALIEKRSPSFQGR